MSYRGGSAPPTPHNMSASCFQLAHPTLGIGIGLPNRHWIGVGTPSLIRRKSHGSCGYTVSSNMLAQLSLFAFEVAHGMCETCRGYLKDQRNNTNLLWVIEGQGQWLGFDVVDLSDFEGWQFTRLHDLRNAPVPPGKRYRVWRCEDLQCEVVLNIRGSWKRSDIYIMGCRKGWNKKKSDMNAFVEKYVQAHCSRLHKKRHDPADSKLYTYEELAAWYAGKYSEAEIWAYWSRCYHVDGDPPPPPPTPASPIALCPAPSTNRPMPSRPRWCPQARKHIVPEFRHEDVALWEQLKFNREGLVEFPEYMARGLIYALQQHWDLKYGGEQCKVIKDGWVPFHNKRLWALMVDSKKDVQTIRRMGSYVVKWANRKNVAGITESALACFCVAEGKGTDFRCDPWDLDLLSRAFGEACEFELFNIHPKASQAFWDLIWRTYFPPMRGCGNDAWPIGLSATAEWTPPNTPSCSSFGPMQ